MAKRKPLVSQHLENISREALEKYENRLNKNPLYGPQACAGKQTLRHAIVRALRGKYAHVRTSSEVFAVRKQEELKQED